MLLALWQDELAARTRGSGEGQEPRSLAANAGSIALREPAERIDREVPRLTEGIAAAKQAAEDEVGTATTIAVVAIVVGAIGLILGAVAIASARKRG